ncbi:MAG: PAS domain-containing sensor histidine kinase [Alphaproteobacteria bacterium]
MTEEAAEPSGSPDETPAAPNRRMPAWLRDDSNRNRIARIFTILIAATAVVAGIATYVAITTDDPGKQGGTDNLVTLIYVDLVLLMLLGVVVMRRIVRIWSERRRGAAGARMHVRLVAMFAVLSATPAVIVAGFSLLFFDLGLESWFSERIRTALNNSEAIAQAYLEEHIHNIEADALWLASAINKDAPALSSNPALLDRVLDFQAFSRNLSEALIFENQGRILARSGLTISLEFEPISTAAIERAREGEVVILQSDADDRVRALIRLDSIIDTYLIIGRAVDPSVLQYVEETEGAVRQFVKLESERSEIQVSFALAFMLIALLLLLAAVWIGLNFATKLSEPISRLIAATERVRGGDLNAQVPVTEQGDELDILSRAFNRMTRQLISQRKELLQANEQIDRRRRFTETVLTGVSAGVIGLDPEGHIDLPNRRASELLGMELEQFIGHSLSDVVPEMAEILKEGEKPASTAMAGLDREIAIERGDTSVTLLVRIARQLEKGQLTGMVVTFDDITALMNAQRQAAWADVARRIAHEIRNPLTPIQLSAERLKRKYLKEITTDPETFVVCTDTIIRQVGDIGRMVDEFSNFAKMPAPTMTDVDLADLCRQQVFLQRSANPDIDYDVDIPESMHQRCDGRQIAQVITNVLQNAKDAIDGRRGDDLPKGRISLILSQNQTHTSIVVTDNGKGFPTEHRDRLTEPYVTTREKGTGLGLAIVKKIVEDHDGTLVLGDASPSGAKVTLTLPVQADDIQEPGNPERKEQVIG